MSVMVFAEGDSKADSSTDRRTRSWCFQDGQALRSESASWASALLLHLLIFLAVPNADLPPSAVPPLILGQIEILLDMPEMHAKNSERLLTNAHDRPASALQASPTARPNTPANERFPLSPQQTAFDSSDGIRDVPSAPTNSDDDARWDLLSGASRQLWPGGRERRGLLSAAGPSATSIRARDLSREAIPPHLSPLVEQNFPAAARLARISGEVTVSAVIQPSGTPTDVRVVRVNPRGRGFGETCSRTVHQGPNWKPKLNRDGRPISAKVTYTCRFKAPDNDLANIDGVTGGASANRIWTMPAGN